MQKVFGMGKKTVCFKKTQKTMEVMPTFPPVLINHGFLFYPNMQFYCRSCGKFDHIPREYEKSFPQCKNCDQLGHMTKDCTKFKVCNRVENKVTFV